MTGRQRFRVANPSLGGLEEDYLLDALRSGWISSHGPYLRRFEQQFAARCGTSEAVSAANGTVALHLALAAAGIGPGDEVIVPALTYIATANAVTYCGADPIFVDVSPGTWCIDVDQVNSAVGPRTRAVIAVDLYGHPADYAALRQVCARHGLLLVADAAESLGGYLDDRPVGGLADVTVFSFFGNKVITCGEGGCATTSDRTLAERMRLLRNQGMDPEHRYFFPVVGFNYRLTNIAAAILCAQLQRSADIVARRERIIARYEANLADVAALSPQPVASGVRRGPWLASFLVGAPGENGPRDELARGLDLLGVETRPFFIPLPELPPYRAAASRACPISRDLARRGINFPTYANLSDADQETIIARVRMTAAALPAGLVASRTVG